jgi:hypothetical protein
VFELILLGESGSLALGFCNGRTFVMLQGNALPHVGSTPISAWEGEAVAALQQNDAATAESTSCPACGQAVGNKTTTSQCCILAFPADSTAFQWRFRHR